MRDLWFVALLIGVLAGWAYAQDKEGVSLTVYNQDFALVRDIRTMELNGAVERVRFSDVARNIDPTSVHFKSLTAPDSCVIEEQNYEYDLLSADKLLGKYIDKKLAIVTTGGSVFEGTLMAYDDGDLVVSRSDDSSLAMISRPDNIKQIQFAALPEGLITKPTLMWQVAVGKEGKHLVEVSYMTSGIKWNCDYIAVIDRDDTHIDVSGWVTIDNRSGATYKDAGLKLIAGDVNRVQPMMPPREIMVKSMAVDEAAAPQFEEKSFFEYHMYTLQRRATVKDNQIKQVTLLNAGGIPVEKMFVFDPADNDRYSYRQGRESNERKAKVKIELQNSQKNHLGMPLPKGKVRVYKEDADGKLEFVGEDEIDHTPKDEKIRLYLGEAFDVVGERKVTDYRSGNDWAEESVEIVLRNHKESAIVIKVVEHLWRHSNWKMTDRSHEFVKTDAGTIEFNIPVAKNGQEKITYKVRYWW